MTAARPPSLLGRYPRPALRLVGAPAPADRDWRPAPPAPQYGIDYRFARGGGRDPVRWRSGRRITVRLTGIGGLAAESEPVTALAAVVGELRALTGHDLVIGKFSPATLDLAAVPEQEIHVGYLTGAELAGLAGRRPGQAGTGDAIAVPDGSRYRAGFAAVNTDQAGPGACSGRALAVLRHGLGHALGLGHAARRSQVMCAGVVAPLPAGPLPAAPSPAGAAGYGRGDRRGLELLGRAAGPPCYDQRMPSPCAAFPSC